MICFALAPAEVVTDIEIGAATKGNNSGGRAQLDFDEIPECLLFALFRQCQSKKAFQFFFSACPNQQYLIYFASPA